MAGLLMVLAAGCTPARAVTFHTVYAFGTGITSPNTPMVAASGKFYGTSQVGGASGSGTVFTIDKATGKYEILYSFGTAPNDGSSPYAGLVDDGSGKLWGSTWTGGSSGYGTIFTVDTATGTVTPAVISFTDTNGSYPTATLVKSGSKLYGTTNNGGSSGMGAVFSIDLTSGTPAATLVASFGGNNGAYPTSPLVEGADNRLWGTAPSGGTNSTGVIFTVDKSSGTLVAVRSFPASPGYPYAGLVHTGGNVFYGTTDSGNGSVYRYDGGSGAYTTLLTFNSTNGASPYASLASDGAGTLYGTTEYGGSGAPTQAGTLFKVNTSTNTVTTRVVNFNDTNGNDPKSAIFDGGDGKLYGTTLYGGISGSGTVFSIAKSTGAFTADVYPIDNGDGSIPVGPLVVDGQGKMYGATSSGGTANCGTVFVIDLATNVLTPNVVNFHGADGMNPASGLVDGGNGRLYGVTLNGGSHSGGSVYTVDKTTQAFVPNVIAFQTFTSGGAPQSAPVPDGSGYLFGTTTSGNGTSTFGAVYMIRPDGTVVNPLITFNGVNGDTPYGGMAPDGNGKMWGTTQSGNGFQGTVFWYNRVAGTSGFNVASISSSTGVTPLGTLRDGGDGKLYGSMQSDGPGGSGTIFAIDKTSGEFIPNVIAFDGNNGRTPQSAPIPNGHGKLYGTTFSGGPDFAGSIYSWDPATETLDPAVFNFNGLNGRGLPSSLTDAGNGRIYGVAGSGGAKGLGVVFYLEGDPTTTTLAASPNPTTTGQTVTLTATVASAEGTPAGTVTFKDGADIIGAATLSGGVASTSASFAIGPHTLTAEYGGMPVDFTPSTSAPVSLTATALPTSVAVTHLPESPFAGQSVGLTATVTASDSGTAAGTVEFFDGATTLGSTTLSGNAGSISIASLTVSLHHVTAIYTPADGAPYQTSTSPADDITVAAATTGTTLVSSAASVQTGTAVTLTATIAPQAGDTISLGTVTYYEGTAPISGAVPVTTNVATLSGLILGQGTHTLTAKYSGDPSGYLASESPAIVVTVRPNSAPPDGGGGSGGGGAGGSGEIYFPLNSVTTGPGNNTILITVARTAGSTGEVSITYRTLDGTALAGVDYTQTTGTLTFASGVLEQTVTVPILAGANPGRLFTLELSKPMGATVRAPASMSVTITSPPISLFQAYALYEYQLAGSYFAAGDVSNAYLAYAYYFYFLYLDDGSGANLSHFYENLAIVYFVNYRDIGDLPSAYAWYDYVRSFAVSAL